jgi:anti-anti-sigma factor
MTDHGPGTGVGTLVISGEIDIANADELAKDGWNALDAAPELLEIDLGDVTFIDSSGLGALVRIRNEAASRDIGIVLVRVPRSVQRVLDMSGLGAVLDVRPDL